VTPLARPTDHPHRVIAVIVAALLAVALLAGCSGGASVRSVTVTAGSVSVTLPAALSCFSPQGGTAMSCAGGDNDDAAPHLAVAPGTPLTIDVPKTVGDTPWVVVFSYIDAAGKQQGDRTAVFPPKKQYSYRLQPPQGAQLTRVEVQSLTAAPGQDGGIEFPAVGTWVLVVDPVGQGAAATPSTAAAPTTGDTPATSLAGQE
jgi:hypothetical protein